MGCEAVVLSCAAFGAAAGTGMVREREREMGYWTQRERRKEVVMARLWVRRCFHE
jgi:hypothetical protein